MAQRLGIDPVIAQVLANRGLTDERSASGFLLPKLSDLHSPELLVGMDAATDRIVRAVKNEEPIVIYGDYDVDGITASSILWHAIRHAGAEPRLYVPHRLKEGYGLNEEAVRQFAADGVKLMITVDCGVTAAVEVAAANEAGMDVIITDHHEFDGDPPVLPPAVAVLHPRHPDGEYPFGMLCGAGVAFKLAWALGQRLNGSERCGREYRDFLVTAVGLAALGTIADVVPLVDENRIIAKFGLEGLASSPLPGVQALLEAARLTGKNIEGYHVGFRIGPRLNAAGRMGHAREAIELLTSADAERAAVIATTLEQQNRVRRKTQLAMVDRAMAMLDEQGWVPDERSSIVLCDPAWHVGVVGIVASRLVDRFRRPTILLGGGARGEAGQLGGSGRSIKGFHLADALTACTQHLIAHGGHAMAAGLSLRPAQLQAFTDAFEAICRERLSESDMHRKLHIDAEAPLSVIDTALTEQFRRLAPFGQENPKPVLAAYGVELTAAPQRMGKTRKHMSFMASQNGVAHRCVAFGRGDDADRLDRGSRIDIAFCPQISTWRGNRSLELMIEDIRDS